MFTPTSLSSDAQTHCQTHWNSAHFLSALQLTFRLILVLKLKPPLQLTSALLTNNSVCLFVCLFICSYGSLLAAVFVRRGSGRCVKRRYFLSWSFCCRTKTLKFKPMLQESSCTLWSSLQVHTHTHTHTHTRTQGWHCCKFPFPVFPASKQPLYCWQTEKLRTLLDDVTIIQVPVLSSRWSSVKSGLLGFLSVWRTAGNTAVPMSLSCCCYGAQKPNCHCGY